MRNYIFLPFLAAFFVLPCLAHAADVSINGSSPCLCAVTKIIECDSQGDCMEIDPEVVNIPTFIKVDFKNKFLSEFNKPNSKTSAIKNFEHGNDQFVLQGAESKRAWSMSVASDTGKMSASVSGDNYGFLLFGACTELP